MSGLTVTVLLRDGSATRPVVAEIVRFSTKTLWVRLPDGNVIKRKRSQVV